MNTIVDSIEKLKNVRWDANTTNGSECETMQDSVCTLNDSRDDALQSAKLFEKAPDMLKVLKDLRDGDYPFINGALWQSINDSIDGLATSKTRD